MVTRRQGWPGLKAPLRPSPHDDVAAQIAEAVARERDACAQIAEEHTYFGPDVGRDIAAKIRARK